MAFSFGAPSAAAPAPSGGGLFGAPAPAPSGGLFGAPAPSGFGSTPAPAAGGLFGSAPAPTNAPAPSGGLFGSTPAPSGGLFGTTPAPAPSGGLFGSTTAPAPSGGLFGTPAPSAFGAPSPAQQQPPQQQYVAPLSGSTPYSQLPPHLKNAVDEIYRQIMSHRRTLASVKTMAPSLLEDSNDSQSQPTGADIAAGSPSKKSKNSNLSHQLDELRREIDDIAKQTKDNIDTSANLKQTAGEIVAMAKYHGLWPIETIATRRQVVLSSLRQRVEGAQTSSSGSTENKSNNTNLSSMPEIDALALQHILDMRASSVDRKEQIPSPYYWEMLRHLETKGQSIAVAAEQLSNRLNHAQESERLGKGMGEYHPSFLLCQEDGGSFPGRCAKLARIQNDQFLHIAENASRLHEEMEVLKSSYRRMMERQRGMGQYEDPFFRADVEEMRKEREVQQKIIEERLLANAATAPATAGASTPAPATGGLFGSTPAPASGGLFGTPAAAPASTGGGLFGSTPAPAAGGLFGTPAPAPSTGGLFGAPAPAAPAPSTGGLFGAPAPAAPAPSTGGLFGAPAPAAPAPSTGGLFGAPAPAAPAPSTGGLFGTPAAAPATGGLFGAPAAAAPAPAGGGLFAAPTTPASTLAPRKKPGSRSGGRRR